MTIRSLFPTKDAVIFEDFTNSNRLDSRIKFSRASTGTYVDKNGIVRTAVANEPRFEYDFLTAQCKGFLIEGARTNIMPWSQDMNLWPVSQFPTVFPWYINNVTVTANAAIAPDGTNTADLVTETNATGTKFIIQWGLYSMSAGAYYTHSVFVKPAGRSIFYIYYRDNSRTFFNLDTGVITGGPPNANRVDQGIIPLANGWFRVYVTGLGVGPYNTGHGIGMTTDGSTVDYLGDSSKGLYFWGHQVEVAPSMTSYIPTLGNFTASRSADVATLDLTKLPNTTNKSFLIKSNPSGIIRVPAFSLNDGSTKNETKLLIYPTTGVTSLSNTGRIVKSGLQLWLDAGISASYPSNANSELITNGSFSFNANGWTTSSSSHTYLSSTQKLQINRSGGTGPVSYQVITTVPGVNYTVTAEVNSVSSQGDILVKDGSGWAGTTLVQVTGTNGQTRILSGTFTASSSITTVGFNIATNSTSIIVDDVSVVPTSSSSTSWLDLSGNGRNFSLVNPSYYSFNSSNGGYIDFNRNMPPSPEAGGYATHDGSGALSVSTYLYNNHTTEILARIDNPAPTNYDETEAISALFVYRGYHAMFRFNASGLYYGIWNSTSNEVYSPDLAYGRHINVGQWFHAVAVRDGNNLSSYCNGILIGTNVVNTSGGSGQTTNTIRFGMANPTAEGYSWHADASVAAAKMYNRALTAAEIQQNFNAIRGRFGI